MENSPREFANFIRNIGKLPSIESTLHVTGVLYLFLMDLPVDNNNFFDEVEKQIHGF